MFFRCLACHSSCETCKGPNDTQCISCPKGHYEYKGQCLKSCPERHYNDSAVQECVECHTGCLECNHTRCFTCMEGWHVNDKGLCVPEKSSKCDAG